MRWKGIHVAAVCVLACLVWSAPASAQEQSEPPVAPDETPDGETSAEPDPTEKEKKKIPFRLYVFGAVGQSDLDDPINSTITTAADLRSDNSVSLDEVDNARFVVGWKMDNNKGFYRFTWNAFSEGAYSASFDGRSAKVSPDLGLGNIQVVNNLPWWLITIENGVITSERTPPYWDQNLDMNGNGAVDLDEVTYGDPDIAQTIDTVDDLENRIQTADLTYGRSWGGRRYSGQWYAGMRYSVYEGNVRAGAWLNTNRPGQGYTDGSLIRLLNLRQEYSGLGPVGMMEAQFNFFDQRLQLYGRAEAAFQLSELTVETGTIFTFVNTTTPPIITIPIPTNLTETRDKSTWQTQVEAGARWKFKFGLELEVAYQIQGFLDIVLLPSSIQIPTTPGQAVNGTSAVYNSHDMVFNSWRVGAGFQF